MRACNDWVLIRPKKETRESGLIVSNVNIGYIHSKGSACFDDFKKKDVVYFNNRNAIEIENYLLIRGEDVYAVIQYCKNNNGNIVCDIIYLGKLFES